MTDLWKLPPNDLISIEAIYFGGFLLSLTLSMFIHELGHTTVAWTVGVRPRLISIGHGPVLLRLRIWTAWLVVRAAPFGGYVQTEYRPDTRGWQRAATIAGGPAANLAVLVTPLIFLSMTPLPEIGSGLLVGIATGQLVTLIGALIPYERGREGFTSVSDALRLYRMALNRPGESFATVHAALLRRHLAQGASLPEPSPHLPEIIFHRSRRDLKHDAWVQQDVVMGMRRVLAHSDLPDGERLIAEELLRLGEAYQRVSAAKAKLARLRREARHS